MSAGDLTSTLAEAERLRGPLALRIGDAADDVLQSAFLAVFQATKKREIRNPRAYFRQTLHHMEATSIAARVRARRCSVDADRVGSEPVVLRHLMRQDRQRRLKCALSRLARGSRAVIVGLLEGEELDAIAERLQMTQRAAAIAKNRGKQNLRQWLSE